MSIFLAAECDELWWIGLIFFFVCTALIIGIFAGVIVTVNKHIREAQCANLEKKISSPEYKESVQKMLAKATVEYQYSCMKPVDNEGTLGVMDSDIEPAAKPYDCTPSLSYTYTPTVGNYGTAKAQSSYSYSYEDDELTGPYVNPNVKATEDYLQQQEIENWVRNMLGL